MGNQLLQEARKWVAQAKSASPSDKESAMKRAKNALSSAYANTTMSEKQQLRELQNELE